MSDARLSARGVAFAFDGGGLDLSGIDLALACGEVGVLLGASGAGKSTLLRVLAGELAPGAGEIRLDDRPITTEPGAAFPVLGYLMQRPERQFFAATVRDEIGFALVRLGWGRAEIDAGVRAALVDVGLGEVVSWDRAPWSLSRGQQRLVALASVLVFSPRLLLLDEPIAGLDPGAAAGVIGAITATARRGAAVLAAGHALDGVFRAAERAWVLNAGRVGAVDLARADDRQRLGDAGLEVPAAWRFLSNRISRFWVDSHWRRPIEAVARDLP